MSPVKYSIRDLERITGIKAHTIRIWEKRYGIIQPERTDTNIRYYSDAHLQKLLNICILNQNGHKISQISDMSNDKIVSLVSELSMNDSFVDADINSMVAAALDLDEDQFNKVLNSCLLKLGFESTFGKVIFPLFAKLNIMWQIGKISACQDRFIKNLVRQKLLVATDGLIGGLDESKGSYLMFSPADHENEIGLLFANYLVRKNGYQVVYLGPSVPLEHLQRLAHPENYDQLLIALSLRISAEDLEIYLRELKKLFPGQQINVVASNFVELDGNLGSCQLYSDYESFSQSLIQ
jgi:DNA-binding transcriptional MerR regulator